jgi:NADP-dependent 3-hydroxy acid dehydrogenase YdfG
MENISGKVVVVTGGSSGMGEATARYLAALGAKLVIGARRGDRCRHKSGWWNGYCSFCRCHET